MTGHNQGSPLRGIFIVGSGVSGMGCAVPILLIAAILLGRQLDAWLGTRPWILLAMLASGIALSAGFLLASAYSASQAAYRDYQARRQPGHPAPADYPRDSYEEEDR